jgi:peptidoglycan hydrolase-like protein with peptidoglycan-binding domain
LAPQPPATTTPSGQSAPAALRATTAVSQPQWSSAASSPTYSFSPAASTSSKKASAAGPRIRSSRARFANTGAKRGATVISFRLSRSAPLVLGVKGPGPSCELAGRVPIAGKQGLNKVRFDGTVRKVTRQEVDGVMLEFVQEVTLEPGTYLLELTSRAGKRKLAHSFVTIVDPKSPREVYARPRCSAAGLAALPRSVSGDTPSLDEGGTRVRSVPAAPSSGEGTVSKVLGQAFPQDLGLPSTTADGDEPHSLLELILLGLVIASLIALAVAVVGSLRRGRPAL